MYFLLEMGVLVGVRQFWTKQPRNVLKGERGGNPIPDPGRLMKRDVLGFFCFLFF